MTITDRLNGLKPVWKRRIRLCLDARCEELLANASESKNRFLRNFYSHIANCGRADAYEFACAANHRAAIFGGAKQSLSDGDKISELFMWFSLYNILRFSREADQDANMRELVLAEAGGMLCLSDSRQNELLRFCELQKRQDAMFELEFADYILKEILGLDEWSRRAHAFTSGFVYESFDGFMRSFTNYSPMKSLLYRA